MKDIIVYILLLAIAEKLVPGENYRRYISITGGLIMIILLISPLVSIMGSGDSAFIEKIEEYMSETDFTDFSLKDITAAGEVAEGFLLDKPDYETVKDEKTLEAKLKVLGITVNSLDITRDKEGEILRVIAYVRIDDEDADGEKYVFVEQIKEYISEIYNLETESIYVVES
jgi:hypothetical protein